MKNYDPIIQAAAQRFNVDPSLIRGIIATESGGSPNAKSGAGANGLMQIMPANYKSLGITDPTDPTQNIMGGTRLLSQLLDRFGDPETALRHYHGGDDQSKWGPINAAYPAKVFAAGGIGAQAKQGNIMPQQKQSAVDRALGLAPQTDAQSIDPFAGLNGAPPAQTASVGSQVDPFEGLSDSAKSSPGSAPVQKPVQSKSQPNALVSLGATLGKGFGSTVLGGQQLLGHGLQALGAQGAGDWLVKDAEKGLKNLNAEALPYEQAHPTIGTIGNLGGSIAATLPLMAAAPVAATYRGAAGIGALSGAASGALAPVEGGNDFWGDKAQQIGLGALTGGVASPVLRGVSRVISPQISSDVQMLMSRGVTPTPGQILGGGFARTEEKLTSVPFLGDMIKNAQQRGVQQFNAAAYNEALAPIGEKFSGKVGQEGIEQVANKIGAAYNEVLPKMQFKIDPQFHADVMNLSSMAQGLPEAQQKTFLNLLKTQIFNKVGPQGNMDGQALKGVQSELSKAAKGYLGEPSYDSRQLGAAVSALKDAVDSNLMRVNSPDLAQKLANANQAWANFARIRAAGASQGAMNNEGVFTAGQLQNAVRSADKSVGKGATATGNALMQDLSGAGQRVLGSKYPDSGTTGRGLMALLAPAGMMAAPEQTLMTLGGIGAGALPYTQLGQRAAAALLTARPQLAQPVGKAVSKLGPVVVTGSLPALLSGSR